MSPSLHGPPGSFVDNGGGTVITFYSYKGGVGRSMAVANIAWILAAKHGKRVIVVDWDLEASGLHRFFSIADTALPPGIIDYFKTYQRALRRPDPPFSQSDVAIDPFLLSIKSFDNGGSIRLMSAGAQRDRGQYVEDVRTFDWKDLYDNWNGAQFIEGMRSQFREKAEITLIDSRTGITDIGGVCTVQLPDVVVFVFAFNEQNLNGIETVASELSDRNNPTLAKLQRWPTLHFLPSRKELSEQVRLRQWEEKAKSRFERFCASSVIDARFGSVINYLRTLSVPYVPYFAYGEELAARSELGLEIQNALDPLVALLTKGNIGSALENAERHARAARASRRKLIIAITGVGVSTAALLGGLVWILHAISVSDFIRLHWEEFQSFGYGALGGITSAIRSVFTSSRSDGRRDLELLRILWSVPLAGLIGGLAGAMIAPGQSVAAGFFVGFAAPLVLKDFLERPRRPNQNA